MVPRVDGPPRTRSENPAGRKGTFSRHNWSTISSKLGCNSPQNSGHVSSKIGEHSPSQMGEHFDPKWGGVSPLNGGAFPPKMGWHFPPKWGGIFHPNGVAFSTQMGALSPPPNGCHPSPHIVSPPSKNGDHLFPDISNNNTKTHRRSKFSKMIHAFAKKLPSVV